MSSDGLSIAIAVFRLSALGGLERHALRLAEALASAGHRVTIYTTQAGALPRHVSVALLRRRGLTNHGRLAAFATDLPMARQGGHDLLVGFQKMPGLDVLFCCDWCFVDRTVSPFAALLPRYRTIARLEAACCAPPSRTRLLMLAKPQAQAYRATYPGAAERMIVLPPTLDRNRLVEPVSAERRAEIRAALGVREDEVAWLWIGLQPRVKGLDRAIRALALAPGARLLVCGVDAGKRSLRSALALARRLGCADRVVVSGTVEHAELDRHLLAADLLVHPARLDVTAMVILEALGAGLPVIVTENCGFAPHVAAAGAGVVVARDASPADLAAAASASPGTRRAWSRAALSYTRAADLGGGIAAAVEIIEAAAREGDGAGR